MLVTILIFFCPYDFIFTFVPEHLYIVKPAIRFELYCISFILLILLRLSQSLCRTSTASCGIIIVIAHALLRESLFDYCDVTYSSWHMHLLHTYCINLHHSAEIGGGVVDAA